MKNIRRVIACLTAAVMAVSLFSGCSGSGSLQFREPKADDEIAVMTVKDYGTIKIRFFEKQAPKAVENFTTHVREGYYDGLTFHRVIEGFMIQGGDPKGNGTGGESIWGEGFGIEVSDDLRHYRGALAMAQSSKPNSIGSQFYIVQNPEVTEEYLEYVEVQTGKKIPSKVKEQYLKYGGVPELDDSYTVFGQVIEGMDVVDKIAAVEVQDDGSGNVTSPKKKVIIEKIVMEPYGK